MAYKEVELDKNGAQALMDSWSDANEMLIRHGDAERERNKKATQSTATKAKSAKSAKKAGN